MYVREMRIEKMTMGPHTQEGPDLPELGRAGICWVKRAREENLMRDVSRVKAEGRMTPGRRGTATTTTASMYDTTGIGLGSCSYWVLLQE